MKIVEKYLEALKTFNDYVTISEWAIKFGEMYPDELQKANEQAINQKNDTTGLREIAARISSNISSGRWIKELSIDDSERPRKVKFISKEELEKQIDIEIEADIEPLKRQDIINNDFNQLEKFEIYKIIEFENIQREFKRFFNLDFEIDHANALLDSQKHGKHHPDNLQLILKYHNNKKGKNSWIRFTFEEQEEYIKKCVELHSLIANKICIEIDNKILNSLLNRLKNIY